MIFERKLKGDQDCKSKAVGEDFNLENELYLLYSWGTGEFSYHMANRGSE
jgi:hypothetical protein